MSNYSLPPPLPTYHVLLEGEGLGQSLGNFKDDLLNVCMRHVEKMCRADLSRSFIERNPIENGGSRGVGPEATGISLQVHPCPSAGWLPATGQVSPGTHCTPGVGARTQRL